MKVNFKWNKTHMLRNISILLLSLVLLLGGSLMVYADVTLGRIGFAEEEPGQNGLFNSTVADSKPPVQGGVGSAASAVKGDGVKVLGGLYHDDAIINVLLLGVDDYQENDVGRSDSMMMITLDTRTNKLKMTSFMRDMFVYIPGIGNNKLNAGYSLAGGDEDGARKITATIEANFGVDIDRWVIIRNSAFNQIVDALGGVEVVLSADEAQQINLYAPLKGTKYKEGTYVLPGAQAHYYSRIRMVATPDGVSDDYGRTLRQRRVFESLVNQLKTSDLGTINSLLVETLPLIKTNLTKNEILGLAGNSLTYMNYPMSQLRIPGDDEYTSNKNTSAGWALVPDLDACSKSLAEFVYEGQTLPKK